MLWASTYLVCWKGPNTKKQHEPNSLSTFSSINIYKYHCQNITSCICGILCESFFFFPFIKEAKPVFQVQPTTHSRGSSCWCPVPTIHMRYVTFSCLEAKGRWLWCLSLCPQQICSCSAQFPLHISHCVLFFHQTFSSSTWVSWLCVFHSSIDPSVIPGFTTHHFTPTCPFSNFSSPVSSVSHSFSTRSSRGRGCFWKLALLFYITYSMNNFT